MIHPVPAPKAKPKPKAMSDALWAQWALSRPASARAAGGTRYSFPCCNAADGTRCLVADDASEMNVHDEAALDGLGDILQPFMAAGQPPAGTNAQRAALIESKRGARLAVDGAFPPFFKDQSKTSDGMASDGMASDGMASAAWLAALGLQRIKANIQNIST